MLLVRRRNEPDAGLWGYPGGHVDWGESVHAAALRELLEETSVRAVPIATLTQLDLIGRDDAGDVTHHFLLTAVLCRHEAGEPRPLDDVSDARWIAVEDVLADALDMSRDVDTVLRLALDAEA